MLELRHLYTLTALRSHGSLAAAADELHVTASAVSHQLKELESYYGVNLVNRSRPVSFTPAGNEVLKLADKILPHVTKTKTAIHRLAHGQTGRLRLASECHSCFDWLMPILNAYRQTWTDVELDFASGFEPDPHQLLLDEEIDVLITTHNAPITGIQYQFLFEYESRLTLAPTHSLADKSDIQPNDLSDQTLIAYPVDSNRLDVIAHFLNPAQVTPAHIRTTELTPMLIQLVASERGVAALPDWVVKDYEKKGWVVSKPLGKGVMCQLYAATRSHSQEVPYMQGFAELLTSMVGHTAAKNPPKSIQEQI